jgi:hypothetical protein
MKLFLRRFFLFFTPLFAIAIIVMIIDPYNYFFSKNFVPDPIKFRVVNRSAESMPRGNTLWKRIDFEHHPEKNILIGDSRAYDLNTDSIRKISGIDFYNFGVPGGNYNSVIETFWYVNSLVKPERVYIQVGFHNYSASADYNLMADAKKVCRKPYLFFSRFYFFEEAILDVYYALFRKNAPVREDKFDLTNWNKVLNNQGKSSLDGMKYPAKFYSELQKISEYCKQNNIELAFIIFPDQQDFHDLIVQDSLVAMYKRYKEDIHSLGKVYDFDDVNSPIIKDRSNYRDIFHLNHSLIYKDIIPGIWAGNASSQLSATDGTIGSGTTN